MIAIIGGGPAGCYTASLLAKAGKDVAVFEEHSSIGKPVQCAGIVTSSINNTVKLRKNIVLNKIKRARIFSKTNFVDIKLKNENLVLDRSAFDSFLAEKAEAEGAKLYLNHKFIGNDGKKVITSKKTVTAEKIIGADGPLSKVAKINNMFHKRKFWIGLQARVSLKNDNIIEFYPDIGTLAWVVPENRETVRIGLLASQNTKNARALLHKFIQKRIGKTRAIEYQGGLIPVYNPKQQAQKNYIYLVGDAACQVKATTGGGIIQSMTAAKALSDSIINNKNYEDEWRKLLAKDLLIHLWMRRVMNRFSEKDWQFLIKLFKKPRNRKILEHYDRDYPSKFALKLLFNEPRLVYFARHLVSCILKT